MARVYVTPKTVDTIEGLVSIGVPVKWKRKHVPYNPTYIRSMTQSIIDMIKRAPNRGRRDLSYMTVWVEVEEDDAN